MATSQGDMCSTVRNISEYVCTIVIVAQTKRRSFEVFITRILLEILCMRHAN